MTEIENTKIFETGEIVYWSDGNSYDGYGVEFGRVSMQFADAVVVDRLYPRERRKIFGIPVNEYNTPSTYKKLPNGWSWQTDLVSPCMTEDPLTEEEASFEYDIANPEKVKEAYEKGYIVKDSEIFHGYFSADITNQGYRIVREFNTGFKRKPSRTTIYPHKLYITYEEAKAESDAKTAELLRQAALTDFEWSVEQIEKTVDRAIGYTAEEKEYCREFLLSLENTENVETRIYLGCIQWKYEKNKRWNGIELP